MKKFKVTVWSGGVNTIAVKDFEDKNAALTHFADMLQVPNFVRLDDVVINPKNVSFVSADEIVDQPAENVTVDV